MNFQNNVSENSEFAEKIPKSRKAAKMASLSLYNIILKCTITIGCCREEIH